MITKRDMRSRRRTLLWRINSGHLKDSYLFGTMHVRDERVFGYFEMVKPFLLSTNVYAAEMDLGQAGEFGQVEDALMPDGLRLTNLIPSRKYDKLRRILRKAFGLELMMFDRLYPMLIVNQIAEAQLGRQHRDALDHAMWTFAEASGKEMLGVESYREQVGIMKQLPLDAQIRQLLEIGRNPSRIRRSTHKLIELYIRMDLQGMYRYSKKGMGKMRQILIYSRNAFMARRIADLVREESCFIAVGAGHLAGGKGLISMLKSIGITLEPIPLPGSGLDNP